MKPQHKHLIVRAEVSRPFRSGDEARAADWLRGLVDAIGMHVVSGPHVAHVDKVGNEGITACVLIETSHCTLHVWDRDEPPLVQLDVYTCSSLNLDLVFLHLNAFEPTKVEWKFLDREHGLYEITV